jgi:hypothetical protein
MTASLRGTAWANMYEDYIVLHMAGFISHVDKIRRLIKDQRPQVSNRVAMLTPISTIPVLWLN